MCSVRVFSPIGSKALFRVRIKAQVLCFLFFCFCFCFSLTRHHLMPLVKEYWVSWIEFKNMDACEAWTLFIPVKRWDAIEIEVVLCKVFAGWLFYLFYFACSFCKVRTVAVCDVAATLPTIPRISLLSTHTEGNAVSVWGHTEAVAYFQLGWWLHSRLRKTKHCCYGTNPGFSSWQPLNITQRICNFQDNFGFGFISDGMYLDYVF